MSKTQVVKALLAAKDTNVNQAHGLFGTPLDIATKNNHTEIIQLLKDAGAAKSDNGTYNEFKRILAV